jgi:serine/threonine-protein kinase
MPVDLPQQFGRYRIVKKLGEGGMGAVYEAEDTVLGRPVALKVPHFEPDGDPKVIERFYREARVAAAIHHANICPVYDVGEVNGAHFITMPLLSGSPLSKREGAGGPWPERRAAELARKVALAVQVRCTSGG